MLILTGGYVLFFILIEMIDISKYIPCANAKHSKVKQPQSCYG